MRPERDEDQEYQLQEDAKLAVLSPAEWARQVAADRERIEAVHRQQAAILRRTSPVADNRKARALIAVDRETI